MGGKTTPIILLACIASSYAVMLLFINDADVLALLGREDGVFESLGAFAFFLAAAVFFAAFLKSRIDIMGQAVRGNIFYLLFALAFFFAAGEEISWGHRILGWELPESIRHWNNKAEPNIHNLRPFSRTNPDGIGFGFSRMFSLFILLYCVALPLGCKASATVRRRFAGTRVPIPPLWLGALCLLTYALSKALELATTDSLTRVYAVELKETHFAILFFAFALYCYARTPDKQLERGVPEREPARTRL